MAELDAKAELAETAVTAAMVRCHHNMPESQVSHHPYNRDIHEVHKS
jgi:hypothetical protein